MRALLLLAILSACARATGGTEAECLRYEPSEVTLRGTLVVRTYPGPPNYESIDQGDAPERPYILVLDTPICVAADPSSELDSEGASNVSEVQLAFHRLDLAPLVGSPVRATGSLFAAHTGHHRTPVLLWATAVRAARQATGVGN